ncbi:Hint domain-containing protein (plasmid) [Sinorhizobium medicae]|uniref:Hint domain-containing protein n=1 Tax=Sinorhizobium medicae TaxID=110321 RepID=UPI00138FBA14|nr:Hint domain-containing protein [Sinorhizobium medicae]WQO55465.1 Hint domain-containing protein [Sinorhizobium medicae]
MPPRESRPPVDQARRHFIGLAAAASARIAALGATIASPGSAKGASKHQGRGPGQGGVGKGPPMCLLRGTAILTSKGETVIEDLRMGDLVKTVRGELLPVIWMGRHVYRRTSPTWNDSVVPIRIRRFALDKQTPRKDLYLSSGHALYVDGVFIRPKDLINGTSVAPALPGKLDVLEFYHIVLATHEAVLAEGAPVETFLVEGSNYEEFTNGAEYARLYPAGEHSSMKPFAKTVGYGGREHLNALMRLATRQLVRPRSPLEDVYMRVVTRSAELAL